MSCPNCGDRPLSFPRWLSTPNPFRIQCGHCGARLRAGALAHLWILCQIPIAYGLVELFVKLSHPAYFIVVAIGVVFCSAYVIPYYGFRRLYRVVT